jgi:hypothetical protein
MFMDRGTGYEAVDAGYRAAAEGGAAWSISVVVGFPYKT